MTKYKEHDNGCKHDWEEIGTDGHRTLKWCEKCGCLRTLYIEPMFGGPSAFMRFPTLTKEIKKEV